MIPKMIRKCLLSADQIGFEIRYDIADRTNLTRR